MGIRIVRVEGIPLTRDLAVAHAALTPMPGEREIRQTRLKFLKGLFDEGLFTGPGWHQGRCVKDGIMYRLDGQHSSHMLASMEPNEIPALITAMTTWEFDAMEDAPDLFNAFNNPRSARTNEDVMGVYKAAHPGLEHLSRKFLVNVANGVHDRENQKNEAGEEHVLPPFGPRERGAYFWYDGPRNAALWLSRFIGTKNQAFLGFPAIVSEMIREWESDAALGTSFWEFVFRESHPESDHETRELAETYREWSFKRRQRAPQYRAKAAKAWKMFTKGQPVALSTDVLIPPAATSPADVVALMAETPALSPETAAAIEADQPST